MKVMQVWQVEEETENKKNLKYHLKKYL